MLEPAAFVSHRAITGNEQLTLSSLCQPAPLSRHIGWLDVTDPSGTCYFGVNG
ncbi:unnamed protein product (plasmid) [Mycetohabitans rhizoxinica HKI 454]|uniref:Uncharacterized protein n=1 Tax=Mycetohabitans rhizoxinica (strain DSM 19002 / CIP 109453 / HKI 454) TaxID=882378 RepID=E5ATK1_MYCRK|nr:unnamed protein product [Mycetohabitans rhizoxinica HKI 454]